MYSALLRTDLEKEEIVCGNDDHKRHTNGLREIDSHKLLGDRDLLTDGRRRKADDRR